MIRIFFLFILFIFIFGCSFNKNSKFWTSSKNIDLDNNEFTEKVIEKEFAINKELNPNIRVILKSIYLNKTLSTRIIIFMEEIILTANYKNLQDIGFQK